MRPRAMPPLAWWVACLAAALAGPKPGRRRLPLRPKIGKPGGSAKAETKRHRVAARMRPVGPPSRAQRGRAGASQQRPKAQHLPEIRYSLTRTSYPLVDAKQAVTGIDNAAKMLHY
jgi:hypothetical protein